MWNWPPGSICRPRPAWRVRRLETEGLIDRRVTLLNARKLGLKVNVFIQISLDKQRKAALDVFEREIAVLPEIMECYLMSGDAPLPGARAGARRGRAGTADRRAHHAHPRRGQHPLNFALKQVLYTTAVPLA